MKKFFPALAISFSFTILMVFQMTISGKESAANKIKDEKVKYSAFESVFSKMSVKTTKGTKIKMAKVKQPIVLLNFWASWCMPCISEFKTLKKFRDEFSADEVLILGVNNDDENPKKAIKKTEKDYQLNFESVVDIDSQLTSEFFISNIPASIVFHKGKVIHFTNEEFNFMDDNFILKIKKLLK